MNLSWNPHIIGEPTIDEIRLVLPVYERIILTNLDFILDRYDRAPDYPFIDTKFSTITGEDFPEDGPDYKSRDVIYGWIQGRGLEALAGHAEWLSQCTLLSDEVKRARIQRIRKILVEVTQQMEAMRSRHDGRLSFCMRPDGAPLAFDEAGALSPTRIPEGSNFTELFYAKGLLAAGYYLGRRGWIGIGIDLLKRVLDDIEAGRFLVDVPSFHPPQNARHNPKWHPMGPRMIALGALALAYEKTGQREWLSIGERFLRHLLSMHLNRDRFPHLQPLDFFEIVTERGRPWSEQGRILSVPGHTLELIGFGAKLLIDMRKSDEFDRISGECHDLFPTLAVHTFERGFNRKGGGIYRSIDLIEGVPIDSNMPWWALPETMRAAAVVLALAPNTAERENLIDMFVTCSNAFVTNYVNPQAHLWAYQTLDENGRPVDIIPATPDADPGYHTGLSLIDAMKYLQTWMDSDIP